MKENCNPYQMVIINNEEPSSPGKTLATMSGLNLGEFPALMNMSILIYVGVQIILAFGKDFHLLEVGTPDARLIVTIDLASRELDQDMVFKNLVGNNS